MDHIFRWDNGRRVATRRRKKTDRERVRKNIQRGKFDVGSMVGSSFFSRWPQPILACNPNRWKTISTMIACERSYRDCGNQVKFGMSYLCNITTTTTTSIIELRLDLRNCANRTQLNLLRWLIARLDNPGKNPSTGPVFFQLKDIFIHVPPAQTSEVFLARSSNASLPVVRAHMKYSYATFVAAVILGIHSGQSYRHTRYLRCFSFFTLLTRIPALIKQLFARFREHCCK